MFVPRLIQHDIDPDCPERCYVVEAGRFELSLHEWDGGENPQVLFTREEAIELCYALTMYSSLLSERCAECGALYDDPSDERNSNPNSEDE